MHEANLFLLLAFGMRLLAVLTGILRMLLVKLFRLNGISMLRGMSSAEDVAIEIRTTAASCP